MMLVTVAFGYWPVSYIAYERGRDDQLKYTPGKEPLYFGIPLTYSATLIKTPLKWNTTDELGIIFVDGNPNNTHYHVLVENVQKIQWMIDEEMPNVKYNDRYYQLEALEVMPGVNLEFGKIVQIAVFFLGPLWILLIVIIITDRSAKKDKH